MSDTLLLLDYDVSDWRLVTRRLFAGMRKIGMGSIRALWVGCSVRQTARGWHLKIAIRGHFSPANIIRMQGILGSDRVREKINMERVKRGIPLADGNLLFQTKFNMANGEVVSQEVDRPRLSKWLHAAVCHPDKAFRELLLVTNTPEYSQMAEGSFDPVEISQMVRENEAGIGLEEM